MGESVPNLRQQAAALLAGTIDLYQFQHWIIMNETAIEQRGSDQEVDFLDDVMLLHAEFTGGHISASQFIGALVKLIETDAVETELATATLR